MAPIRDSVSHSSNQTGLEHPGLEPQYDPSPWSSGSPCNSNWGKVLADGSSDNSNNPSSTNSSVWPPSSFSCSSSSSSGCGSGSGSGDFCHDGWCCSKWRQQVVMRYRML